MVGDNRPKLGIWIPPNKQAKKQPEDADKKESEPAASTRAPRSKDPETTTTVKDHPAAEQPARSRRAAPTSHGKRIKHGPKHKQGKSKDSQEGDDECERRKSSPRREEEQRDQTQQQEELSQ